MATKPANKAISENERKAANEGAGMAVKAFRGIVRKIYHDGLISSGTAAAFRREITQSIKARKRPGGLGHK